MLISYFYISFQLYWKCPYLLSYLIAVWKLLFKAKDKLKTNGLSFATSAYVPEAGKQDLSTPTYCGHNSLKYPSHRRKLFYIRLLMALWNSKGYYYSKEVYGMYFRFWKFCKLWCWLAWLSYSPINMDDLSFVSPSQSNLTSNKSG